MVDGETRLSVRDHRKRFRMESRIHSGKVQLLLDPTIYKAVRDSGQRGSLNIPNCAKIRTLLELIKDKHNVYQAVKNMVGAFRILDTKS